MAYEKSFVRQPGRRRIAAVPALSLLAAIVLVPSIPGVESIGGTAWAQVCPAGAQVREVGHTFLFRRVGRDYRWTIYRKPNQAQVGFRHEAVDGSWSEQGTIDRWPSCPRPNTTVFIVPEQGQPRACARVCLSDGRQELHCPGGQIVMSRPSPLRVCVDTLASEDGPTPTPTPEPRPRPCLFRIGCQDYNTCVSCCAEDGDNISECGFACWFSGGDLGTGRCDEDPFPPEGHDDALSCVPIQGYPNWCDREMPAF